MPRPTRARFPDADKFEAAFTVWHTKLHNFSHQVEARVEEQYDLIGAGDLCYNLMDTGTIPEDASLDEAARITAMHIAQS